MLNSLQAPAEAKAADKGGAELASWKEGCTFKCKSCPFTATLRSDVKKHCIAAGHGKGTTDCYEITVRDFYPCVLCKRSVLRESKVGAQAIMLLIR